ncbi:ATP synthase regulation protein NCA2-domain-containing protein [Aspergillus caelatus]|uniref:ATP synthase regulation protein NCA2-domain-containing protein n=1 Tax=Aspergillus caelatus TaxID=61420 RepID=A0A5N7A7I1_9EURO|nr:ATP synthase regulation protein NCA2-domain-containing protein [Aspergillus caelatus]KAE8365655.1 ATP synthase regulation protein NCA2-domain-containing protein [Aspergillus caelatus]
MSVINDDICRLDTQLDQIKQEINDLHFTSLETHKHTHDLNAYTKHISDLENVISSLSVPSKFRPMLPAEHIVKLTLKLFRSPGDSHGLLSDASTDRELEELTWLAVTKATVQTLGVILRSLLDRSLLLSDEISYWDTILGSYWHIGVYTLQTLPFRLWRRLAKPRPSRNDSGAEARFPTPASVRWTHFYEPIQRCFFAGNLHALPANVLSPFVAARSEIRRKRERLKLMKDLNAHGIGLLMRECFPAQANDDNCNLTRCISADDYWRKTVCRSVTLMEIFLQKLPSDSGLLDLGEDILSAANKEFACLQTESDGKHSIQAPELVAKQLQDILLRLLPAHNTLVLANIDKHRRPSRLVRYWLPLSMLLLTASTSFKVLKNRRHQLIRWVASAVETTVEFWSNWVFDPIQRLIGTIRHDEKSEIALMSKNSLEADRASLERMVVDFILDRGEPKPEDHVLDISSITNKVREGDLTPVLRAYEKDLRTPFVGTVRGDLVRALLIQIQKTKVDVEIAIGGIDALLKSQELVFGFVGLTPGILVSYASLRWFWGLFGNRKGLRMGRRQDDLRHALRAAHRTLISPTPAPTDVLAYRDHGLLICDAEVLLQKAEALLSGAELRAFREDVADLINQKMVVRQLEIVGRLGWAYSKWMQ